jgi:SNF2 family DNA or RNA helicase
VESGWEKIDDPLAIWELAKYAELRTGFQLMPHQQRAVDRAEQTGSILLAHGTGSGKGASSIAISENAMRQAPGRPAVVVVPAALRNNYVTNVEKFSTRRAEIVTSQRELDALLRMQAKGKKLPGDFLVFSWELMRSCPEKIRDLRPSVVVYDEMHHARDPRGENWRAAMIVRSGAPRAVGLTGSVVSNTPDDIPPLLAIITGGLVSPHTRLKSLATSVVGAFNPLFGEPRPIREVTHPDVIQRMGRFIDFVDSRDIGEIPDAVTEYVPVEMSSTQSKLYDRELSGLPRSLVDMIIRGRQPASTSNNLLARITRARQAAQSTYLKYGDTPETIESSPKVKRIVDDAVEHLDENPSNKVVIYTNLVNSGVRPLHLALKQANVPHSVFIGAGNEIGGRQINKASRQLGVDDYMAGKNRVIVLSGAGAEGLDLKNSTMFQAAEGHFNPEIVRQAQARTQRIGALQDRPPEQRKVVVRRYVSVEPAPGIMQRMWRRFTGRPVHKKTTDEWMYDVARAKHVTNEGVRISLEGKVPMQPGEKALPTKMLFKRPVKYVSRAWNVARGEYDYEYARPL